MIKIDEIKSLDSLSKEQLIDLLSNYVDDFDTRINTLTRVIKKLELKIIELEKNK